MPKYDQHFLKDDQTADKIVRACDIRPEDVLIEIGPGKGVLTSRILKAKPKHVLAVEVDDGLCAFLKRRFEGVPNLTIVKSDFLKLDLGSQSEIVNHKSKMVKFLGNLPYSMTNPILQKVIQGPRFDSAVFMFQKEVAERILAAPGNKRYGLLTLAVHLRAQASWVCSVHRTSFIPRPRVDSAVLKFCPRSESLLPEGISEPNFFRLLRAAFGQRRKTIFNSLSHGLKISKQNLLPVLEKTGIGGTQRAEEISLEGYLDLAKILLPTLERIS
ncbi:MAG: ribosomal RNA small subunit methyltransferase A [Elusimicrobia bacterium]|nr:ribosomal RNA small subunit methyltransferase A [Elusimicrobiota bacterium]